MLLLWFLSSLQILKHLIASTEEKFQNTGRVNITFGSVLKVNLRQSRGRDQCLPCPYSVPWSPPRPPQDVTSLRRGNAGARARGAGEDADFCANRFIPEVYDLSIKFATDCNKWNINCVRGRAGVSPIASLLKGAQLH